MGFNLLSHSIRMITGNAAQSLRLSSPILVLLILGLVLVGPGYFEKSDPELMDPSTVMITFLLQLFTAIAALWVAVAWHRFILLEEYPNGALPVFHGKRMLAYFGYSLLIGIVIVIPVMLAILLASLVFFWIPVLAAALGVVLMIAASWAFYRLSPILPATAIDQKMPFKEAWAATGALSNAILVAMVLFVLVSFGIGLIGGVIMLAVPILGGLVLLVLNWFVLLLGISLLTTIYGVAVEGRAIR